MEYDIMNADLLFKLQTLEKEFKTKYKPLVRKPEDYIGVKNMEKGFVYVGICRNAMFALWEGTKFIHLQHEWGGDILCEINHIDDLDDYDCFYPVEKIKVIE